jgi:hypothetical protein
MWEYFISPSQASSGASRSLEKLLLIFAAHWSSSWGLYRVKMTGNDAYALRNMVIAGDQLSDAEYSKVMNIRYVHLPVLNSPFDNPTRYSIRGCWTSPLN